MVPPNGPLLARSGSTWIHWWSPVASANMFTWSWVTSCQSLEPRCSPSCALRSLTSIVFAMDDDASHASNRSAGFERLRRAPHVDDARHDGDLEAEAGSAAEHALRGHAAADLLSQMSGDVE